MPSDSYEPHCYKLLKGTYAKKKGAPVKDAPWWGYVICFSSYFFNSSHAGGSFLRRFLTKKS